MSLARRSHEVYSTEQLQIYLDAHKGRVPGVLYELEPVDADGSVFAVVAEHPGVFRTTVNAETRTVRAAFFPDDPGRQKPFDTCTIIDDGCFAAGSIGSVLSRRQFDV